LEQETPIDPSDPEVTPMQRALEVLFTGLNSDDQRRRIHAATGLTNYYLAREIGRLIDLFVQGPEGMEADDTTATGS
jgi:hypothetical protein